MGEYNHEYRREYYRKNADRINAYNRKWRRKKMFEDDDYRERQNELVKEYHKTDRGKASQKAGSLNASTKKRGGSGRVSCDDIVHLWRNMICENCGRDDCKLHVDHIVPIAMGGKNEAGNLQLLCPSCHKEKTGREKRELMRCRIELDSVILQ